MYKQKFIIILIVLFWQIKVSAQNYLINFESQNKSRKIDSVKIENFKNNTFTYVSGNETLMLSDTFKNKQISVANKENIKFKKSKNIIEYKKGDLLKFTAFSGNAKTIVLNYPDRSKIIKFYFADCVDIDGNSYAVIKIGNQLWTVDNLKTTRYNNGDSIINVTDNENWNVINSGAYRNYFDNKKFVKKYGRLYNWFAVTDKRGLAPEGWRIPNKDDWNFMQNIKMPDDNNLSIGSKLKEKAFVPAGYCDVKGGFANIFNTGYWWLSTSNDEKTAWYTYLFYYKSSVNLTTCDKHHGFSVRCVKDIK